jgi:CRP/FNR family cyclic AMP-dependent transcriptional regulator
MKANPCLSESRLSRLFNAEGRLVQVPKGRTLQFRGDSRESLYYVVKGHVLLHLSSIVGKHFAVDVVGLGALIGLGALRAEPSHHLDATTFSECMLRCLPAKTLKCELLRDPELCLEVFNWTNDQLARRASQIEEIVLTNLESRIARLLINQLDAQQMPLKTGVEASIPSQKTISTLVGSSRESVNKELRRLHERRIIAVSRHKVRILNAAKLKQQAEASAILQT